MRPNKPTKNFHERAIERLSKGATTRASEDVNIVLIGLLVLLIFLVDTLVHFLWQSSQLYKVLPIALGQLSSKDWLDVLATSLASVIAFVAATAVAYLSGIVVAIFVKSRIHGLAIPGLFLVQIYRFFYIVPLVLSVTLIMVILFNMMASGAIGAFWFVFGILLTSSLCIAGYPVFSTVYGSIVDPDRRQDLLVDSIYIPSRRFLGVLPVPRQVLTSKRLNDGAIRSLAEGVERAWHLTIVSVVIVETIVPAIYQHLLGELRLAPGLEVVGVGRSVLVAQSSLSIYKVFGLMWALFIVDLIGVKIINSALRKRYLRHYGREQDESTGFFKRAGRLFRGRLRRRRSRPGRNHDAAELAS